LNRPFSLFHPGSLSIIIWRYTLFESWQWIVRVMSWSNHEPQML
jgi:hypothetical protein